jgi:sugar lactone lactonase YvrE
MPAKTDLEVYRPGSEVRIGKDISAIVNAVCISANGRVTYEVVWWDGRTRKSDWLASCEVEQSSEKSDRKSIGFHH